MGSQVPIRSEAPIWSPVYSDSPEGPGRVVEGQGGGQGHAGSRVGGSLRGSNRGSLRGSRDGNSRDGSRDGSRDTEGRRQKRDKRMSEKKRKTMRVPIRVQLALLVLLSSLTALAVVSIAVVSAPLTYCWDGEIGDGEDDEVDGKDARWEVLTVFSGLITIISLWGLSKSSPSISRCSHFRREKKTNRFDRSQSLALTASLKAAQVAADLELIESTCGTIVTRILIQTALDRLYAGNDSDSNWLRTVEDVQSALASGGFSQLLQVRIYSRNQTGNPFGLVNVTSDSSGSVVLPWTYENGTSVNLDDVDPVTNISLGMPASLYPNLTYSRDGATTFGGDFVFGKDSKLLLGPLQINATFSVVSITLPIINNNTFGTTILGYMTVVAEASALYNVQRSREGLDDTGVVLILRPQTLGNRFPTDDRPSGPDYAPGRKKMGEVNVRYVFPPALLEGQPDRHVGYNMSSYTNPFPLKDYPAALSAFAERNPKNNNASSTLDTQNEQRVDVAVGWARPQTPLADWVLLVEQTKKEAFAPVAELRKILLGCVFGTIGVILLLVVPTAHFSVLPITRLKEATEKSVQPPGYSPSGSIRSEVYDDDADASGDEENAGQPSSTQSNGKKGFLVRMRRLGRPKRRRSKAEDQEDARRRVFKIPGKVVDRKHFVTDELTELTETFNEMSDELMMQYARLEERVEERTRELEVSKKAAEAANESKTLFIANISHELKTPLNGILGMCAVCMGEDDLPRIKRSLQVVYKSGDLLLHLLNDLLTFSKNQIGQTVSIEQKEFGLSDIKSQIVTIFDKQVKDGNIDFDVKFIGTEDVLDDSSDEMKYFDKGTVSKLPALGPNGTGRLKDMRLWGDQHRILQVVINLVSNSLKFTPEGGKVEVRIKCLGEHTPDEGTQHGGSRQGGSRKDSTGSKGSKVGSGHRNSRNRHRHGSGSEKSGSSRLPSSSNKAGNPIAGTALQINPTNPRNNSYNHDPNTSDSDVGGTQSHFVAKKVLDFEFEVKDTGPGIPKSFQERVFEPFVQADLGLSKKYGGTGLGLSICSQLAGLMGGGIELESVHAADFEGEAASDGEKKAGDGKIKTGTTFRMRIPLGWVRERASSTASSSNAGSRHGSRGGSRTSSVTSRPGDMAGNKSIDLPSKTPLAVSSASSGDVQPRLVGLSQPFFASPGMAAGDTEEQLKQVEKVVLQAKKEDGKGGKIRVLVAEDNLVNQEVVLR